MTRVPTIRPCPRCGRPADGRFCAACGAPVGDVRCSRCGVVLDADARFCKQCGTPATTVGQPAGRAPRRAGVPGPWYLAGALAVVTIAVLLFVFRTGPGAASATGSPDTAGTPPDLSTMTPREQFQRLSDRVTAAAEQGDTATLNRFWPMVLGAYQNLPPADRDADARFHMGWLRLHLGDTAGAVALADSILAATPSDLFGYYLRATIAEAAGDSAAERRARSAFDSHYTAEIARDRVGYAEHRTMFERFRTTQKP